MSGRLAWVLAGCIALVVGTLAGWNAGLFETIARPPALIRAVLVSAMVLAALRLVAEAVHRISAGRAAAPGSDNPADLAALIRGVRFVFLAVAAASAAGGWLLGSALPLVTALLIAGVDVVETGFLLVVVSLRGERSD